ncbi:hypothetical protein AYO47_02105 [Planctomyces sp. SCGC AG-212-M04]|nr:hypothetical protein AYO47_02105 [Planctomyces sp. SCGC AG-212-M04]
MDFAAYDIETPLDVANAFVELLPRIGSCLRRALRHLRAESREDAFHEAVASCFAAFARLCERGLRHLAAPAALARFAISRWFDGRRVGSRLNRHDLLTPYARCRHGLKVFPLEAGDAMVKEATLVVRGMPVPDQVAFRIDFPSWLRRLTVRDRGITLALAGGDSTSQVSQQFGLSPARVSQLRRELHDSWRTFQGELDSEIALS